MKGMVIWKNKNSRFLELLYYTSLILGFGEILGLLDFKIRLFHQQIFLLFQHFKCLKHIKKVSFTDNNYNNSLKQGRNQQGDQGEPWPPFMAYLYYYYIHIYIQGKFVGYYFLPSFVARMPFTGPLFDSFLVPSLVLSFTQLHALPEETLYSEREEGALKPRNHL